MRSYSSCAVFGRLTRFFYERRKKYEADVRANEYWTERCRTTMHERSVNGQTHTVRVFDHPAGEYDVVSAYNNRNGSGNHTYRVYLDHTNMTGSCSCGIFQHSKILCSHAYVVCNTVNLNPYHFVHPMFRLSKIAKIYVVSFLPIDGPKD